MKEWYEGKKVIHEFKCLLHEIQKYDCYDEKEEALKLTSNLKNTNS